MGVETGTDGQLLARIREGDAEAYRALYDRYSYTSTALAHAVLPEAASDVVQDVWLLIWETPPDCVVGFDGWLRNQIRNAAKRRRRRLRRTKTLSTSEDAGATTPTREVARQEAVDILRQARREGKLTDLEFTALVDHIYDDTTSTEIATVQGLSRTGWLDRVRRARRKLRAIACGGHRRL